MEKKQGAHRRLLRIKQVRERIPVAASTWWRWVNAGIAPKPVKIGEHVTAWYEDEVDALVESLRDKEVQPCAA